MTGSTTDRPALRAGVYARVSSAEQVTGTSLDDQRTDCAAEAARRGWEVVDEYVDAGVSGALESRPQLDRLLADVHSGKVQAVITAKVDRLARDELVRRLIMRDLANDKAVFVALDQRDVDHTSDEGEMFAGLLGTFAQFERKRIRARTMAGKRARVAAGGWGGGEIAPYGYRVVGKEKEAHLELDDREAAMIRRAVALLLDHGMSTGEAARALNAEGFTPRKAPRWSATNLRNVLVRGEWTGAWVYGKGQADAITVAIPPLLDVERAAALDVYLCNTTRALPQRGRPYPLTGRLYGTCGHSFHGIGRADRSVIRYRCTYARDLPHHERCPEPSVRAEEVEQAVWTSVLELLADPQRLMDQAAEHLGLLHEAVEGERDALLRAKVEVERRQEALVDASATGLRAGLDPETLRQVVARLQQDLADAQFHLRQVAAMQAETGAQLERVSQVQSLALLARERLVTADQALQQRILGLLDVRVTVLDHGDAGHRGRRGGPVRLRVEGSVTHDLLLLDAERDWHPSSMATGPA